MLKNLSALTIVLTLLFSPTVQIFADVNKSIVENAGDTDDLTTLVAALDQAELTNNLEDGSGDLTVLAPNNDAFLKLGDNLETLLLDENKDLLGDILKYHIISGKFESSQVSQLDSTATVFGDRIGIDTENDELIFNDSAKVVSADIEASNGIIHIIDTVLLSSDLEIRLNSAIADQNSNPAAESTNQNDTQESTSTDTTTTPRTGGGSEIMFYLILGILSSITIYSLKGTRGFFR